MRRIKVMTDYGCWPLWTMAPDEPRNVDPDELPLSQGLRADLADWGDRYDATLNQEYPPDSGFPTDEDERDFERTGRTLWTRLRDELGSGFEVHYFSSTDQRLLAPSEADTA